MPRLKPDQLALLPVLYARGMPYREIARQMGVTEGAVRFRLRHPPETTQPPTSLELRETTQETTREDLTRRALGALGDALTLCQQVIRERQKSGDRAGALTVSSRDLTRITDAILGAQRILVQIDQRSVALNGRGTAEYEAAWTAWLRDRLKRLRAKETWTAPEIIAALMEDRERRIRGESG